MVSKSDKEFEEKGTRGARNFLNFPLQKRYQDILITGTWQDMKTAIIQNNPQFNTLPDYMFELMFHKGRCARPNIPEKLKAESAIWLAERDHVVPEEEKWQ